MKSVLVLFLVLIALPLFAQDPPSGVLADIGVDQKLNAALPLDLIFHDESGKSVPLERFFHKKPVVLSLVYYECPMLCSMTLNGLVKSMRAMPFHIGDEFEVLTIS